MRHVTGKKTQCQGRVFKARETKRPRQVRLQVSGTDRRRRSATVNVCWSNVCWSNLCWEAVKATP